MDTMGVFLFMGSLHGYGVREDLSEGSKGLHYAFIFVRVYTCWVWDGMGWSSDRGG